MKRKKKKTGIEYESLIYILNENAFPPLPMIGRYCLICKKILHLNKHLSKKYEIILINNISNITSS